jgi:hypothetical protein
MWARRCSSALNRSGASSGIAATNAPIARLDELLLPGLQPLRWWRVQLITGFLQSLVELSLRVVDLLIAKRRQNRRCLVDDPGHGLVHQEVDLALYDEHVPLVHALIERAIGGGDEHVEPWSEELRRLGDGAIDRSAGGLTLLLVEIERAGNLVGHPPRAEVLEHAGATRSQGNRADEQQPNRSPRTVWAITAHRTHPHPTWRRCRARARAP